MIINFLVNMMHMIDNRKKMESLKICLYKKIKIINV